MADARYFLFVVVLGEKRATVSLPLHLFNLFNLMKARSELKSICHPQPTMLISKLQPTISVYTSILLNRPYPNLVMPRGSADEALMSKIRYHLTISSHIYTLLNRSYFYLFIPHGSHDEAQGGHLPTETGQQQRRCRIEYLCQLRPLRILRCLLRQLLPPRHQLQLQLQQ